MLRRRTLPIAVPTLWSFVALQAASRAASSGGTTSRTFGRDRLDLTPGGGAGARWVPGVGLVRKSTAVPAGPAGAPRLDNTGGMAPFDTDGDFVDTMRVSFVPDTAAADEIGANRRVWADPIFTRKGQQPIRADGEDAEEGGHRAPTWEQEVNAASRDLPPLALGATGVSALAPDVAFGNEQEPQHPSYPPPPQATADVGPSPRAQRLAAMKAARTGATGAEPASAVRGQLDLRDAPELVEDDDFEILSRPPSAKQAQVEPKPAAVAPQLTPAERLMAASEEPRRATGPDGRQLHPLDATVVEFSRHVTTEAKATANSKTVDRATINAHLAEQRHELLDALCQVLLDTCDSAQQVLDTAAAAAKRQAASGRVFAALAMVEVALPAADMAARSGDATPVDIGADMLFGDLTEGNTDAPRTAAAVDAAAVEAWRHDMVDVQHELLAACAARGAVDQAVTVMAVFTDVIGADLATGTSGLPYTLVLEACATAGDCDMAMKVLSQMMDASVADGPAAADAFSVDPADADVLARTCPSAQSFAFAVQAAGDDVQTACSVFELALLHHPRRRELYCSVDDGAPGGSVVSRQSERAGLLASALAIATHTAVSSGDNDASWQIALTVLAPFLRSVGAAAGVEGGAELLASVTGELAGQLVSRDDAAAAWARRLDSAIASVEKNDAAVFEKGRNSDETQQVLELAARALGSFAAEASDAGHVESAEAALLCTRYLVEVADATLPRSSRAAVLFEDLSTLLNTVAEALLSTSAGDAQPEEAPGNDGGGGSDDRSAVVADIGCLIAEASGTRSCTTPLVLSSAMHHCTAARMPAEALRMHDAFEAVAPTATDIAAMGADAMHDALSCAVIGVATFRRDNEAILAAVKESTAGDDDEGPSTDSRAAMQWRDLVGGASDISPFRKLQDPRRRAGDRRRNNKKQRKQHQQQQDSEPELNERALVHRLQLDAVLQQFFAAHQMRIDMEGPEGEASEVVDRIVADYPFSAWRTNTLPAYLALLNTAGRHELVLAAYHRVYDACNVYAERCLGDAMRVAGVRDGGGDGGEAETTERGRPVKRTTGPIGVRSAAGGSAADASVSSSQRQRVMPPLVSLKPSVGLSTEALSVVVDSCAQAGKWRLAITAAELMANVHQAERSALGSVMPVGTVQEDGAVGGDQQALTPRQEELDELLRRAMDTVRRTAVAHGYTEDQWRVPGQIP